MSYLKFGDQFSIDLARSARLPIEKMRASFGSARPGELCGMCVHFYTVYEKGRDKGRCRFFERTHQTKSDWPVSVQGCGKYREDDHA